MPSEKGMHILFHLEKIENNAHENNSENSNRQQQISQKITYGYSQWPKNTWQWDLQLTYTIVFKFVS